MTFLDDVRRLLKTMKDQFELAGDRNICFTWYNPSINPNTHDGRVELLYAKMVNCNAGKIVQLSTMISKLEAVIQSDYDCNDCN